MDGWDIFWCITLNALWVIPLIGIFFECIFENKSETWLFTTSTVLTYIIIVLSIALYYATTEKPKDNNDSLKISEMKLSEHKQLLEGYIALSEAENMVNRIYTCIDNLKGYRLALDSRNHEEIEYFNSLCSDIYGCGMHLYMNDYSDEGIMTGANIKNLCEIIDCDYKKVESYFSAMEQEIITVTKTYEHLYNYQQTRHDYFLSEYEDYMENIELRKSNPDYYQYCITVYELKSLVSNYLNI